MRNDLDAASFERYLREEGLARIVDLRAARGETDRPGREVYSRCAKALIAVGDGGDGPGHDLVLGFPLEIVVETSPAALRGGEDLVVRVLFAGKPLADVEVVAVSAAAPEHLGRRRTDENGRVWFPPIVEPGAWLLTTIHMVPAPPDVDADWESFWASFTFERSEGID